MTTAIKRKPIAYAGEGSAVDFYLNQDKNPTPPPAPKKKLANWGVFDKDNTQHRTILSLMRQAQWTKDWNGREVPDIIRLSDFLHSDKSPVNKALKKMETHELSKIIVALEGIVEWTFKNKKR